MEMTVTLSADVDRHGNPERAYLTISMGDGQRAWIADAEFGPFDTWLDLNSWMRKQVSLELDRRFA